MKSRFRPKNWLMLAALLCWLGMAGKVSAYTRADQFPGLSGYTTESFITARYSMAYHARLGQMILLVHDILDRYAEGTPSHLYFWRDGQWLPLPGVPPTAGGLSVMVYDSRRGVMVFWQGRAVVGTDASGVRRIRVGWTWEWDGTNWRLASDQATTWDLWPDNQWRQSAVQLPYGGDMEDLRSSPGPDSDPYYGIFNQAVAFDARRGRVVMLGGIASLRNRIKGYIYEWDGATWRIASPQICRESSSGCEPFELSSSPFAVQAAAMAFHPPSGRIIIHGGLGQPAFYFFTNRSTSISLRTYTYDGERVDDPVQSGPFDVGLRRAGHAMVWDEFAGRLVMFGGQTYNVNFDPSPDRGQDCWNAPAPRCDWWDGTKWVQWSLPVDVNLAAYAKYLHAAAYDPKRHEIVVFGGLYNYRFERNPLQDWYDCLFNGWNSTWRIGFAEAWVDYSFTPGIFDEDGSFNHPWVNLRRARDAVSSQFRAVIRVKPGHGTEGGPITISQPRVLEAPLGPVTIGR